MFYSVLFYSIPLKTPSCIILLDQFPFFISGTYTGTTLEGLKQTCVYHHGTKVTVLGIGDLANEETRGRMRQALHRIQVVVKTIQAMFAVYRSETSWLALFTVFRLRVCGVLIACLMVDELMGEMFLNA